MIDVVSMAHDTGLQWLDGLLTSVSFHFVYIIEENQTHIFHSNEFFHLDFYAERGERH